MMTTASMPDLGIPAISSLPYDAVRWEVLKTALELKIFDVLVEPASAEAVAESLSLHGENTAYLLKALVGLGCVELKDGLFCNTAMADTFLAEGRQTSIGAFLLHMDAWNQPLFNGGMADLVRNGPPPPQPIADPAVWAHSARIARNESRCARAPGIAAWLARLPEFTRVNRILDLGAGSGMIGIAVALARPSASCILFDRHAICDVAQETIEEYGLTDRVSTMSGDYTTDPIGEGYDLIMANYTLNFYFDGLDAILQKTLAALNPGGMLFVTSDGMSPDKTAPAQTVIGWLSVVLQGMDMSAQRGEIALAMRRAGFVATMSDMPPELDNPAHGPTDITVGWKAL